MANEVEGAFGELSGCSRRRILAALPGIVILPGVLAACSTDRSGGAASQDQQTTTVPETEVDVAEVPVGSAKVVQVPGSGQAVVVAQPSEGEFVAFSASCTHQGARVQVVEGTLLRCPLHGAEYDATTGAVTNPPASRPLDKVSATVEGSKLKIS